MADDRRNADLPARAATAVAMVAVTGLALWLGGMVWLVFILAAGVGVWLEWRSLVLRFTEPGPARVVWSAAGAIYCGVATAVLMVLRDIDSEPGGSAGDGLLMVSLVLLAVVATDVGAYFAGRAIGGPKIAPRISPSKTWAGLAGGIVLTSASLLVVAAVSLDDALLFTSTRIVPIAIAVAVVAQAGDFFESWMKRRAGVKDSGSLLPGHGGLFDRLDGLMAVLFVIGILLPFARLEYR